MKNKSNRHKLLSHSFNYFDFESIFKPYWDKYKLFIVVGEKNIGKTFSTVRFIQNLCRKNNQRFAYVRRSKNEIDAFKQSLSAQDLLWENYTHKGSLLYEKKIWRGQTVYLSGNLTSRGAEHRDFYYLIFDEFIGERFERPISFCLERLAKVISNFARQRLPEFKTILIGNFNHLRSEYLNAWGIEKPKVGNFVVLKELGIVCYFTKKENNFASHNKEFEGTALNWVNYQTRLQKFLISNEPDDLVDLYYPLSKLENNIEFLNFGIIINDEVWNIVTTCDKFNVIVKADEKSDLIKYYSFDIISNIKDNNSQIPLDIERAIISIATDIKNRILLLSDLTILTPLLMKIKQFITMKRWLD